MNLPSDITPNWYNIEGSNGDYSNDTDSDIQSIWIANKGYASRLGPVPGNDSEQYGSQVINDTYNCQFCQNQVEVIKGKSWNSERGYYLDNTKDTIVSSWANGNNANSANSPFGPKDNGRPHNVFWVQYYNLRWENKCDFQCVDACFSDCYNGCRSECVEGCTDTCVGFCNSGCQSGECVSGCTSGCDAQCLRLCTAGCWNACTSCAGPGA